MVFENFNQWYPAIMQRFSLGVDRSGCDIIRNPAPAVGQRVALASLKLEHLTASFIVDASHFFKIELSWEWPLLSSLVLTSNLLTPDENPIEIGAMLQAAAAAALKRCHNWKPWRFGTGERAWQQATIIWRGTWTLAMDPSTIEA